MQERQQARRPLLAAAITLLTLVTAPRTAMAATIHVTGSNGVGAMDVEDNGNCSLIEAILSANNNAGEDACEDGESSITATDVIVLPPDTLFSADEPFPDSNRLLPNLGDALIIEGNGSTLERTCCRW